MSSSEEIEQETLDESEDVPLTKPVKVKKARTAKQIEALAKGREKIKENVKLRREQKKIEASKLLLANGIESENVVLRTSPSGVGDDTCESSEEEQQIQHVYIKKAKAKAAVPKKKKKKIIVYQDASSDSDGESDSSNSENYVLREQRSPNPRPQVELHRTSPSATSSPIHRQQAELHKFKSQRNKKSAVKVYDPPVKRQPEHQQINYFCD